MLWLEVGEIETLKGLEYLRKGGRKKERRRGEREKCLRQCLGRRPVLSVLGVVSVERKEKKKSFLLSNMKEGR